MERACTCSCWPLCACLHRRMLSVVCVFIYAEARMLFQTLATNHRKYYSFKKKSFKRLNTSFIYLVIYLFWDRVYVALAVLYEKQAGFRLTKICLLCFSIAGIKGVCISMSGFHISYGRKSIKAMEIIWHPSVSLHPWTHIKFQVWWH